MNDVLCHVVLAERDVNLGARNGVRTIGILHRFRSHCTNIRASVGLGEVHRACPLTRDHLWQVRHALHFVSVVHDRINCALCQQWRHGQCHVG